MPNPRRSSRLLLLALLLAAPAAPLGAQATSADTVRRGEALFEQKRYAEARELLAPYVRAHPKDAPAAFYLGVSYAAEGEHDAAIRWLERAASLDPQTARYPLELAGAYAQKAMRSNVARQALLAPKIRGALERAAALDPGSIDARMGLVQFYTVAPGIMGGSKAKARAMAAEVRRLSPYRGVLAFGYVHMAEKKLKEAESEYRAALAEYPDSASIYLGLVGVYSGEARWDDLFALLDQWQARRPGDRAIQYQLGRAGALSGQQLERAERALRAYLEYRPTGQEPTLAAAHWRLGMIYEKQGKPEQAKEEYRTALRLEPALKDAREALRRLGG